jgi:hypothetical protein
VHTTGSRPTLVVSADGRGVVNHAGSRLLADLADATGHPDGTRVIVRRERPHPGAQLSLFDLDEGMRHQVFLTDTPNGEGSLQHLEVRHRAHARVEDRIRCGKSTGFGRFPSRHFAINQAWLELSLTALDLLAWTQTLLLEGELAAAEPKKLRYRLLHAAARITRGGGECSDGRTASDCSSGWCDCST